jgi:hypothetical protein
MALPDPTLTGTGYYNSKNPWKKKKLATNDKYNSSILFVVGEGGNSSKKAK